MLTKIKKTWMKKLTNTHTRGNLHSKGGLKKNLRLTLTLELSTTKNSAKMTRFLILSAALPIAETKSWESGCLSKRRGFLKWGSRPRLKLRSKCFWVSTWMYTTRASRLKMRCGSSTKITLFSMRQKSKSKERKITSKFLSKRLYSWSHAAQFLCTRVLRLCHLENWARLLAPTSGSS